MEQLREKLQGTIDFEGQKLCGQLNLFIQTIGGVSAKGTE